MPYVPRPSRTKQLEMGAIGRDKPSVETPDEFKTSGKGVADKILAAKEEDRKKREEEAMRAKNKRRRRRNRSVCVDTYGKPMLINHGVVPLPNPTQLPTQIPALAQIPAGAQMVRDPEPVDDADILHLRRALPCVVALLLLVEGEKTRMTTSQEARLLRLPDHHLEARPDVGGHRPRKVDDRIYGIIWACMIIQQQDLPSKVLSSPVGQVVHPLHQPWPQIPLALPRACSLPC